MQALVTLLSGHVWFAVTESGLRMADSRQGALFMAFTGAAIFGCHGIPVEAVSTPLAVAAIRIPDAFQAFSGDRITAPGLQGVNVAIAVTREAGIPRHCWVSIVTVCASLAPIPCISRRALVTDHFVTLVQVTGGAEIVGGGGEGAGTRLAVPGGPL